MTAVHLVLFLVLFTITSIRSTTRQVKTSIVSNSVYRIGYFGNFILNGTTTSRMRCLLTCQNHEYCRLANYDSSTSICSLIDEYSFVGKIQNGSSSQSIILLQLCLDPTRQEPEYLCFGSRRPPVLLQQAINSSRIVKNISLSVYISRITPSGLLYIQEHATDRIDVYDLQNYQFIQTIRIFSNVNKRNFDADFSQNFFVFTGHTANPNLYMSSSRRNRTISASAGNYYGICMSDNYIFVTRNSNGNLLDIFHRSNGSLISQLNLPLDSNGCVVIRDELFISTDTNGLKSMIVNVSGATIKSWPIGIYRQGWTHISVDSAGRTYIPCSNCGATYSCIGYSVCALISESMNNTLLAQVKDYWYISGRSSKYVFQYVGADYQNSKIALFEY